VILRAEMRTAGCRLHRGCVPDASGVTLSSTPT
jgi:hypothetical protein